MINLSNIVNHNTIAISVLNQSMKHNNTCPTLSETLTGLPLQLKPQRSLLHVPADWLRPERGGVNADARQVFQHGHQTKILIWICPKRGKARSRKWAGWGSTAGEQESVILCDDVAINTTNILQSVETWKEELGKVSEIKRPSKEASKSFGKNLLNYIEWKHSSRQSPPSMYVILK